MVWRQSWEHACGKLSDSPGTLWLSAFKIYIFEQNSTKFQKKSLYNITIFILFMHSSLITSVYMSDLLFSTLWGRCWSWGCQWFWGWWFGGRRSWSQHSSATATPAATSSARAAAATPSPTARLLSLPRLLGVDLLVLVKVSSTKVFWWQLFHCLSLLLVVRMLRLAVCWTWAPSGPSSTSSTWTTPCCSRPRENVTSLSRWHSTQTQSVRGSLSTACGCKTTSWIWCTASLLVYRCWWPHPTTSHRWTWPSP